VLPGHPDRHIPARTNTEHHHHHRAHSGAGNRIPGAPCPVGGVWGGAGAAADDGEWEVPLPPWQPLPWRGVAAGAAAWCSGSAGWLLAAISQGAGHSGRGTSLPGRRPAPPGPAAAALLTPPRPLRPALAPLQVFYAAVGASANIPLVLRNAPVLFLFSFIALSVHLVLLLVLGRLAGFSRRDLLLASNANIGGGLACWVCHVGLAGVVEHDMWQPADRFLWVHLPPQVRLRWRAWQPPRAGAA